MISLNMKVSRKLSNYIKQGGKPMACPCKQNKTKSEILLEFGDESFQKKCNSCPNFVYDNGLLTCEFVNEDGDSDDNK